MYNRDPYRFVNHDTIPESILRVVIGVFRSWDMPFTDYDYVECFKPDGVLLLGPHPTEGREALRNAHGRYIRPNTGPMVLSQHFVDRLFTLPGTDPDMVEVVVNGLHQYVMRDGSVVPMPFASWIVMSKSEEEGFELQAERWHVYQDHAKLVAALARIESYEAASDKGDLIGDTADMDEEPIEQVLEKVGVAEHAEVVVGNSVC